MLNDLTYTNCGIRSAGGYDFGHRMAFIRSPHSAFDNIWQIDTSHAAGGARKLGELIHTLARSFIERASTADLRNAFEGCFEEDRPAIFMLFDGGEDKSEEATHIVVIAPSDWRLQGSIDDPWCVAYSGFVFDVDDMDAVPDYRGGFWNREWMEQTSMSELETSMPALAAAIRARYGDLEFSEPSLNQNSFSL